MQLQFRFHFGQLHPFIDHSLRMMIMVVALVVLVSDRLTIEAHN